MLSLMHLPRYYLRQAQGCHDSQKVLGQLIPPVASVWIFKFHRTTSLGDPLGSPGRESVGWWGSRYTNNNPSLLQVPNITHRHSIPQWCRITFMVSLLFVIPVVKPPSLQKSYRSARQPCLDTSLKHRLVGVTLLAIFHFFSYHYLTWI